MRSFLNIKTFISQALAEVFGRLLTGGSYMVERNWQVLSRVVNSGNFAPGKLAREV
jgi:hypothetical protein